MVEIVRRGARNPWGVPFTKEARPVEGSGLPNGPGPSIEPGLTKGTGLADGAGPVNGPGTLSGATLVPGRRLSLPLTFLLLDALAVALALVVATRTVAQGTLITLPGDAALTYPQLSVLLGTGWIAALTACRRSVRLRRGYWRIECGGIARAAFIVLGVLCMAAVVLPLDIDRPFVAVAFTTGLLLQLASRWLVRLAVVRRMRSGARTAGPRPGTRAPNTAVHE